MLTEQLTSTQTEESNTESQDTEWTTPSLDEQSACAEICAYVYQQ